MWHYVRFNPTMVRLLPFQKGQRLDGCGGFQSHNGAIAALFFSPFGDRIYCFNPTMVRLLPSTKTVIPFWAAMFQSHNGAIAASGSPPQAGFAGFVSIPQWCDCCIRLDENFLLAIKVSIPQWCDCCWRNEFKRLYPTASFNPTMVRLLPKSTQRDRPTTPIVSIPQWCDCCRIDHWATF